MKGNVGAGILNIITESLYDKPIVVFREYIQNSVDSFKKMNIDSKNLFSRIWFTDNTLYFLDNGTGIGENNFLDTMIKIAGSKKRKTKNIGYKGIGRLSGMPYCKELIFINICSYKNNVYQKYSIDSMKYRSLKDKLNDYDFDEIMDQIGAYSEKILNGELTNIKKVITSNKDIFINQDTGFLVILKDLEPVLRAIIEKKESIYEELGWLLPVKFKEELLTSKIEYLLEDIKEPYPRTNIIPAETYNINFNGKEIERPISLSMLRDYTCKNDFEYAIGFITFYRDKISIDRKNKLSGIKLYLDNILLCDESELIPVLHQYNYLRYPVYELIQSVKGIGAIIYIVDKVNISSNARRTFIELSDIDSFKFLEYLSVFIENIYQARYELSKYRRASKNHIQDESKFIQLKEAANAALQKLATDKIEIEIEESLAQDFSDLTDIEKKQIIKGKLTKDMNIKIKEYLQQTNYFDYDNATKDFLTYLLSN